MRITSDGIALCIGLVLLAQAGCASSKPSRFYLLSAESPSASEGGHGDLALGVGPIEFPKYLDRPQIVTRANRNRLDLAEFDRWGEPLEQNFARVLGENLSTLLSTDNVALYPWKRSAEIHCQIIVHVNRFDAAMDEGVVLHVRWTVLDADDNVLVPTRGSRIVEPLTTQSYSSFVQAASLAVDQLSRQVASAVRKVQSRSHSGDEHR